MFKLIEKFSVKKHKLADDILDELGNLIYQHYIYGNSQVVFRLFEKKVTPFGDGYEVYGTSEVITEKDKDRLVKDIMDCLKVAGVTLELSTCGHLKVDLAQGHQDFLKGMFSPEFFK